MKKNKGITLISLVLTIVLILVISGTMGYYSTSAFSLQKINNMYSDIEQIQAQVDEYYIKNNELPILEEVTDTSNITNKNINDNEKYYVIDLSKLKNLNLNYGKDFDNHLNINSNPNVNDIYIINEDTQTIYYLKGIEFENKTYYTKPIEYKQII